MSAIVVVEPHPLLRIGLLQLLSSGLPGKQISGADYSQVLNAPVAEQEVALVILSISSLRDMEKLITAVTHAYAPKSILLLAEEELAARATHTLPPTVAGYVHKNLEPEILQASVKLVLAGGACFPLCTHQDALSRHEPSLETCALMTPDGPGRKTMPAGVSAPGAGGVSGDVNAASHVMSECEKLCLTPRQYEVLVLLARGYPMKTVGRLLNISVATAKAHTEMLYQRLDVHSRNAAVYEAVSRGATLGWPSITTAKQNATKLSSPP